MTRSINDDDEQTQNSTDDQNAEGDAQDAEAKQDGVDGADQDVTENGGV